MIEDDIKAALKKAYHLGQTYWQQADSESLSQHKKADATACRFHALVDTTVDSALSEIESLRAELDTAENRVALENVEELKMLAKACKDMQGQRDAAVAALKELSEATKEVLRISDRKHDAWDRAHAAIAKGEAP